MSKSKNRLGYQKRKRKQNLLSADSPPVPSSRMGGIGDSMYWQFGGRRDISQEVGYKQGPISFSEYDKQYDRHGLASRIIEAQPIDTWKKRFIIESEDDDFIKETESIFKSLSAWQNFTQADIIAGIGAYGAILIGVNDGVAKLSDPVTSTDLESSDLLYLRPLTQDYAQVKTVNADPKDKRFGLPELYKVKVSNILTDPSTGSISSTGSEITVHQTRIIHIAEKLKNDRIFGIPRLQQVFDYLFDALKITASQAEAYWRLVGGVLQFNIDPTTQLDDKEETSRQIDEIILQMRSYIRTKGMEIKNVSKDPSDPSNHYDTVITAIAAAKGWPKRKLTGSERGDLSSTQDESGWNGLIEARQEQFAEPVIVRALINRFIDWGILADVNYDITWPSLFVVDDKTKSETIKNLADATKAYEEARLMAGGAPSISQREFRKVFSLPPDIPDEDIQAMMEMLQRDRMPDVQGV